MSSLDDTAAKFDALQADWRELQAMSPSMNRSVLAGSVSRSRLRPSHSSALINATPVTVVKPTRLTDDDSYADEEFATLASPMPHRHHSTAASYLTLEQKPLEHSVADDSMLDYSTQLRALAYEDDGESFAVHHAMSPVEEEIESSPQSLLDLRRSKQFESVEHLASSYIDLLRSSRSNIASSPVRSPGLHDSSVVDSARLVPPSPVPHMNSHRRMLSPNAFKSQSGKLDTIADDIKTSPVERDADIDQLPEEVFDDYSDDEIAPVKAPLQPSPARPVQHVSIIPSPAKPLQMHTMGDSMSAPALIPAQHAYESTSYPSMLPSSTGIRSSLGNGHPAGMFAAALRASADPADAHHDADVVHVRPQTDLSEPRVVQTIASVMADADDAIAALNDKHELPAELERFIQNPPSRIPAPWSAKNPRSQAAATASTATTPTNSVLLPWLDPRRAQRRRPLVTAPPFMLPRKRSGKPTKDVPSKTESTSRESSPQRAAPKVVKPVVAPSTVSASTVRAQSALPSSRIVEPANRVKQAAPVVTAPKPSVQQTRRAKTAALVTEADDSVQARSTRYGAWKDRKPAVSKPTSTVADDVSNEKLLATLLNRIAELESEVQMWRSKAMSSVQLPQNVVETEQPEQEVPDSSRVTMTIDSSRVADRLQLLSPTQAPNALFSQTVRPGSSPSNAVAAVAPTAEPPVMSQLSPARVRPTTDLFAATPLQSQSITSSHSQPRSGIGGPLSTLAAGLLAQSRQLHASLPQAPLPGFGSTLSLLSKPVLPSQFQSTPEQKKPLALELGGLRNKFNFDVPSGMDDPRASYVVTQSGTFQRDGFALTRDGMQISADAMLASPVNPSALSASSTQTSVKSPSKFKPVLDVGSNPADDYDDEAFEAALTVRHREASADEESSEFEDSTTDDAYLLDASMSLYHQDDDQLPSHAQRVFTAAMKQTKVASPVKPIVAQLVKSHFALGQDDLVACGVLGRGASAVVLRAFALPHVRWVALKVISVLDQQMRQQIMRELRALLRVLPALPCDESADQITSAQSLPMVRLVGAYYDPVDFKIGIAMQFCNAGTLQSLIEAAGPLPESMIRHIARSTVRALAWLHSRRIVHRDVKPHNLLLHCELQPTSNIGYTGGGWQTLLSDFGIMARLKDADDVSRTLVGTLQYMSPERLVGSSYSYAADVWSCGLVMATAALGYVPLDATQGHWGLVHHIQSREIRLPERIEVGQTRAGMLLSPLGSQSPARARPNHNETGEVRIFSAAFRDFIAKCLERDPEQRASAESLLRHPFVVGSGSEAGDEAEARLHWSLVHQAMTRQAQCTADAATHDKYVASIVSRIKSRTAVGDREETLRRLSRTLNLSVDMLSSMWDQC